jgi:hypothetical protein
MKKDHLDRVHRERLGRMSLTKGVSEKDGHMIIAWDVVPACQGDQCPAACECDYINSELLKNRCSIMYYYLKYIYTIIYRNFEEMDEHQTYMVGMHLLPMYRMLCRLKIEEIGVKNLVTLGSKGALQMNPLYREMRDTIKAVMRLWKELELVPKRSGRPAMPSSDPFDIVPKHGEDDFVGSLSDTDSEERIYETEDGDEIVVEPTSVSSTLNKKPKLKRRENT